MIIDIDLDAIMRRPSWQRRGACGPYPKTWWYPNARTTAEQKCQALALCESCPVRAECLEYALEHHEQGMWAGTIAADRRRIRRERAAAARVAS